MEKGDSMEYFYAYDGLIRKRSLIELTEDGILEPGFKLKSKLMEHLSRDDEIAYTISVNGTHEFSVPLSFLALLLRCREYDDVVNEGRQKPFRLLKLGENDFKHHKWPC